MPLRVVNRVVPDPPAGDRGLRVIVKAVGLTYVIAWGVVAAAVALSPGRSSALLEAVGVAVGLIAAGAVVGVILARFRGWEATSAMMVGMGGALGAAALILQADTAPRVALLVLGLISGLSGYLMRRV